MGKRMTSRPKGLARRFVLLVVLVCTLSLSGYAWLVLNKMTRTSDLEVIMPPIIYIRDDQLEEMTSFNLDGLQINEPYYALFCVAPAYKGVVEDYKVGVIYTENIGMVIDLFPVTNITAARVDGMHYQERLLENTQCFFNFVEDTQAEGNRPSRVTYSNSGNTDQTHLATNLNRGIHKLYSGKFTKPDAVGMDIISTLNDTEAYRFYVLRVTWKSDITEAELEKETDAVYIVTKGGTGGSDKTT